MENEPTPKIHPAIQLILQRIDSNPEEFESGSSLTRIISRWGGMLDEYREYFTPEEDAALQEKIKGIRMTEFHHRVMQELLSGGLVAARSAALDVQQKPYRQSIAVTTIAPIRVRTNGPKPPSNRAEIGVDGNAGFALLGDDLQSGEAEFVEIDLPVEASRDPNRYHKTEWVSAAKIAANTAYKKLKARLSDKEFSYYLGPSHPDHLG